MNDELFDKLMRDAAETYRRPPTAPTAAMWDAIERETFGPRIVPKQHRSIWQSSALRIAAVLVLGVAIGRGSVLFQKKAPVAPVAEVAMNEPNADSYQLTTERYLGETTTLLASLPGQLRDGHADSALLARASQLLSTTRVLMDSPAAQDRHLRTLFEDLELVLAQVVQMPKSGSSSEARLIRQTLQERDVMPRLRDAVADPNN